MAGTVLHKLAFEFECGWVCERISWKPMAARRYGE